MKRLLILFLSLFLLTSCDAAVIEEDIHTTPCIAIKDLDFYAATIKTKLGTADVIMVETLYGDVEIDQEIYEYAVLGVYSHICFDVTNNKIEAFASTRQKDLDVPEPPTIEVPVIEYVDREVEKIVYTHDLIDPADWIATLHPVYYYYVQDYVVNLVYTNGPTVTDNMSDMYIISIVFDQNLVLPDKVMVASVTHFTLGYFEGALVLTDEFENAGYETIEAYIEAFIADDTYEDIVAMYNNRTGGTYYGPTD